MNEEFVERFVQNSFFNRPIGTFGASRSGTTILRRMLGQHTNVLGRKSESPLVPRILELMDMLMDEGTRDWHRETVEIDYRDFRNRIADLIFECNFGSDSLAKIIEGKGELDACTHWAAQFNLGNRQAEMMRVVYPEARLILIVRNGIQVVHSMLKHFNNRSKRGLSFEHFCENWAKHVKNSRWVKDSDFAIEVRHEDLLADRKRVLGRIFDFCNLPYSNEAEDFVRTTVVHPLDKSPFKTENSSDEFEQRPSVWNEWDNSRKETFRRICSESMDLINCEIPVG